MTWFRVDDDFASHKKLEPLESDPVRHAFAIAAWTLMGTDCSKRRTDGRFTETRLRRVLPWPTKNVILARDALIESGLWRRVDEANIAFHDWEDYQPTRDELNAERKAATERQKRWRLKQREKKLAVDASTNALRDASHNPLRDALVDGESCAQKTTSRHAVSDGTPSRPVPSRSSLTSFVKKKELADSARCVFEHWRSAMGKSSKLDDKRQRRIEWAIREYGLEAAKKAIDGCAKSDWHMGRDPKSTGVHNGIDLIFRDAAHFERFLEFADKPPRRAEGFQPPAEAHEFTATVITDDLFRMETADLDAAQ